MNHVGTLCGCSVGISRIEKSGPMGEKANIFTFKIDEMIYVVLYHPDCYLSFLEKEK